MGYAEQEEKTACCIVCEYDWNVSDLKGGICPDCREGQDDSPLKNNKYTGFNYQNGTYIAAGKPPKNVPRLVPGAYELQYNDKIGLLINLISTNSDSLIDLPSPEYTQVVGEISQFLKPETKTRFKEMGFLYKRSMLLEGPPGTGKTCIVNRVAQKVIDAGGIVIFNPDPRLLEMAYEQLNDIQPNTMTLVIFEELDQLLRKHEGSLLSVLDGEIQKDNVVYVATTNFINEIPGRVLRPGRFSSVIKVGFPTTEAREAYLKAKNVGAKDVKTILKSTENFSIDELTEVVRANYCLGIPLDVTVS